MDDLTRERYPHGVPYAERYARPSRRIDECVPTVAARQPTATEEEIAQRRVALTGTDVVAVVERDRHLVEAIRRTVA